MKISFHNILPQAGHDLSIKDSCGTSDPYVKFFHDGKMVFKSKTVYKDLNPFWDETFDLILEDISVPLDLKVTWIVSSIVGVYCFIGNLLFQK